MKTVIKILMLCCIVVFTACSKGDDSDPADPMVGDPSDDDPIGMTDPPAEDYTIETIITGLTAPQGIEIDAEGRLWVAEQGTGVDDGRISMIDQNGDIHPFLINIPSATEEGSAGSAHHLLIDADTLWAVVGMTSETRGGELINLQIGNFDPGDAATDWGGGAGVVTNIADLVLNHDFDNQTNQSNAYNLTKGPEGLIYIVDAAANAVIKYDSFDPLLEVVAELPQIANATGIGPPFMDAVPTGIQYLDDRLLVSAFVGFPFTPGDSRIYSVTPQGSISNFRRNLTGAVDLLVSRDKTYVVEYAEFGTQGFQSGTGRVLLLEGNDTEVIADELDYPNGICMDSGGTLYVTSAEGNILKITKN